MTALMALTVGVVFACGVYLALRRSTVRMLLGVVLITHAGNLLVFMSGGLVRGSPPIVPKNAERLVGSADPLPQALVLTAIVIGFGLSVFAAALVERIRRRLRTDDPDALREEVE